MASAQVSRLVDELRLYNGYRTLWLDRRGYVCHSEPDDELETHGYTYLTTVMRPSYDELAATLGELLRRRQEAMAVAHGVVPLLAATA
ncbi:MAG: hypothetical protein IPK80_31230 [Nannocystis sp.]|jgi:hypothetical protein|nr:hypothetical protein [Nannocystis sp.]